MSAREVNDLNLIQTMQGLEQYLRHKFDLPNKANIRYNASGGYIYYIHFEYYDTPVPGETDIYEVKSHREVKLIEKPTREQVQLVQLINLQLELATAALLKE